MIRSLFACLIGALALSISPLTAADEKEPVVREGTLVCGKCKLKETEACSNVLVVLDKDKKETKFYIKDDGKAAEYHVCSGAKAAKSTGGKVTEKDGKKTLEGAKIELVKKDK